MSTSTATTIPFADFRRAIVEAQHVRDAAAEQVQERVRVWQQTQSTHTSSLPEKAELEVRALYQTCTQQIGKLFARDVTPARRNLREHFFESTRKTLEALLDDVDAFERAEHEFNNLDRLAGYAPARSLAPTFLERAAVDDWRRRVETVMNPPAPAVATSPRFIDTVFE
jgi:hypothetical protein